MLTIKIEFIYYNDRYFSYRYSHIKQLSINKEVTMFSFKNKLDADLRNALDNKIYKTYRVNISCKALQENIEKKVISLKGKLIHSNYGAGTISANLTSHAIERLLEFPEVGYIAMDYYAFLCGSSVLSANGIGFQDKYKLTGRGIGVGIIDSGVYPHADLLYPNNKIKSFVDLINGFKYPYDDNGHGTFVSGLICGSGGISKGMYKGIAENCSLHCIKAFNSLGKGYISDILYAIDNLINNSEEHNTRVLCLPFELSGHDDFILKAFSTLFDKAIKKGIIPIVPSGSNGNTEGSMCGIATLSNCITIGGLDTKDTIIPYRYSSAGPCGKLDKPDLSAACVDICSLNTDINYISERNGIKLFAKALDKPYTSYTGTSCAAAYISGVCALLLENNPNLTYKDILSLLKVSCTMINTSKWFQGNGAINLNKLLP